MFESQEQNNENASDQVHNAPTPQGSNSRETNHSTIVDTSTIGQDQASPIHLHPINIDIIQGNQSLDNSSTTPSTTRHTTPQQQLQHAQVQWKRILDKKSDKALHPRTPQRQFILTAENHRVNNPWGDPLVEKSSDVTRLYSLNVNGLSLDKRGGKFDELCKIMKEVQADIVCCQEHNLDTTKTSVRSILNKTARQHWSRSRLTYGTSPTPFLTDHKPGGTMITTVGDITGRVISQSQDKWGRWSYHTIRGSGSTVITVISAYQVVTDNPNSGTTTAAAQQRSLLLQARDQEQKPRKAFKRDLLAFLKERRSQGDDLILVGDFNEVLGSEVDGMSQVAAELELINLMQVQHHQPLPATYSRGKKCLDYGLATHRVAFALRSCGYEAFNERFPTDHRAYYFDFDTDALFGNKIQTLAPSTLRILKSNNAEQVTQYIKLKFEYLTNRNAFTRAARLTLPGNRHAFAERLDSDILKSSLDAERNTRQFREPAWSIALSKARRRLSILRKCLSMYRTGLDQSHIIHRDMATSNIDVEIPPSKRQCYIMLKEAKTQVDKLVATSFQQRDQEQADRIQRLEQSLLSADRSHAALLRRLRKNEKVKRMYQKVKAARERGKHQGLTRLEIPVHPEDDPKTCTEWRMIDVPSEIVEHLQKRNRQHFGQAHGTPFTIDPLASDFGFCGDSLTADAVLDGTYQVHPEQHASVQLLIQHLKMTHEVSSLATYPTVSLQEFQGKIDAWRESTTTSPSGMHLGHYKALFAKHKYSHVPPLSDRAARQNDEHTQEHRRLLALKADYDSMQQSLAELHLSLLNYSLERGYSYTRWQSIANTTLFKDPGSVKIHRTRVIHIYEADFNLTLGLKWRIALYQSEALKQLNEGQYGSRPRRNALDPVMIEELQFEISRASRRMFLQTNYDATACYDRIIPNLAMMVSRRFGVAKQATECNAQTLQRARYHIKTELGLSETSYSHSQEIPIYGTGQGSGNSPMIWCFLSSLLYDCYDLQAHPALYCNPDWTNPCQVSMVGFVDDSNGQVNSFYEDDTTANLQSTVHKAKTNATIWSHLLQATGGALELSKCSYHVLYWKFSSQGAPVLCNIQSEIPALEVPDPITNTSETLEYLPPTKAHKTLGHFKEPSGLHKEQYRQLKAKSDQITDFLWSTHLTREEAWLYYQACYIPAVTYPLTSSFLSPAQLKSVQTKAMAIITAKCGFNRHTKTEVLFGPRDLGGADFRHLTVQQGIAQTMYFLRHWRLQSPVGKLLKCALSWQQFSAGVSFPILENTETALPHLESKWMASLRSFLASIGAGLQLDEPCVPPMQRANDRYIMDLIIQSARYKPADIRKLNYCRLYLNVVTLTDITKPNGHDLDPCFVQGQRSLYSSSTRWHTVNQERPSEKEWRLWQSAQALWSNPQGKLNLPLGAWLLPLSGLRVQFFAYKYRRSLFIRTASDQYEVFRQHGIHSFRPSSSSPARPYTSLPDDARPVEVELCSTSGLWQLLGLPSPRFHSPIIPPSATATFDLFINTLSPWEIDLLQQVTLVVDPFSLCLELTPGFRAVSDGSVKNRTHGSFGWVISSLEGQRLAYGMGPARGRAPHSYRAEASGLLSILRFLHRIKEYTGMHEPWVGVIATDSQGVLDTLQTGDKDPQAADDPVDLDKGTVVLDCLRPEWDLLIEIQVALSGLPEVTMKHVKGHQDKTRPYHSLDLLAQLNVDADTRAGDYHIEYGAHRPFVVMSPLTRGHLVLPDGTVTGRYKDVLNHESTTKPLLEYIRVKNSWTVATIQSIHWDAHAAAIQRTSVPHTHLVKLLHQLLPTHAQSNKFDGGRRQCPVCTSPTENHHHILRCEHASRSEWRQLFQRDLRDHLIHSNTSPLLSGLLLEGLRQWFASASDITLRPEMFHPSLRFIITQQNRIGWSQIFLGRFGFSWSSHQQGFLSHNHNRPLEELKGLSLTWQISLIKFVWERWHTLWRQRNQDVHGFDATTRAEASRREVRRNLNDIYRNRNMYEEHVQQLLLHDVEDHERFHVKVTKNWISLNAPIFRESFRKVQQRALGGMRSIQSYFSSR
jgi:exonuclease III